MEYNLKADRREKTNPHWIYLNNLFNAILDITHLCFEYLGKRFCNIHDQYIGNECIKCAKSKIRKNKISWKLVDDLKIKYHIYYRGRGLFQRYHMDSEIYQSDNIDYELLRYWLFGKSDSQYTDFIKTDKIIFDVNGKKPLYYPFHVGIMQITIPAGITIYYDTIKIPVDKGIHY